MDADLDRAQALILQFGTAYRATLAINAELEERGYSYRIDKDTPRKILNGQCKPAMAALIRFVLQGLVHFYEHRAEFHTAEERQKIREDDANYAAWAAINEG